jgi:hypothetical protein
LFGSDEILKIIGGGEVLEINTLAVEDFVVEGGLESCGGIGDGSEVGERKKLVFPSETTSFDFGIRLGKRLSFEDDVPM